MGSDEKSPLLLHPETTHLVVKVKQMDRMLMADLANSKPYVDISIGETKTVPASESISNTGAGPCVILYLHNLDSGEMTSGHYPFADSKENDERIGGEIDAAAKYYTEKFSHQDALVIADKLTTEDLSRTQLMSGYFGAFLSLVKDLQSQVPPPHLELYLFGQSVSLGNFPDHGVDTLHKMRAHWNVTASFTELGLPTSHIHDFRQPHRESVDSTFYDADEGVIYWARW